MKKNPIHVSLSNNLQAPKDILREAHIVNRRLLFFVGILLALVAVLVARLAFLQWLNYDTYYYLSEKNAIDIVPIAPFRGLIFDRHGIPLATNMPVYNLHIIRRRVKDLDRTLRKLNELIPISEYELKRFSTAFNQKLTLDEIPLKENLTEEQIAIFSLHQQQFLGVTLATKFIRHYEYGAALAHVLGHLGPISEEEFATVDEVNYSTTTTIGKTGIEKYYEQQLHGHVGYEKIIVDARGNKIQLLERSSPINGDNLYLTLDLGLQQAALRELAGHRGAIIALDPQNGEILALASMPSFDPQLFIGGISTAAYNALIDDPAKPLFNRALNGLYPIGSTIKPFIALAGLHYGTVTPEDTIQDPGYYQLPNSSHIFHDWLHTGHGEVNLRKAVAVSCDTYFYQLAYHLGIKRIDEFLHQFGLGQLTHIDLADESTSTIPSPDAKRIVSDEPWGPADTIMTGIGQSYTQITPLDLAYATSIIANRGKIFQPHLLKSIKNDTQNRIDIHSVALIPLRLHKSYWNLVIRGMQDVVEQTYGFNFHFGRDAPYTAAGKTGTAQVARLRADGAALPKQLQDHSLFIGFAPVDKPKIVVVVILEHEKLAATAARHVMDYYLTQATV